MFAILDEKVINQKEKCEKEIEKIMADGDYLIVTLSLFLPNSYLVNFKSNEIYKYSAKVKNNVISDVCFELVGQLKSTVKETIINYINEHDLLQYQPKDIVIDDVRSNVTLEINGVYNSMDNVESACTDGKIHIIDDLKKIIENG